MEGEVFADGRNFRRILAGLSAGAVRTAGPGTGGYRSSVTEAGGRFYAGRQAARRLD